MCGTCSWKIFHSKYFHWLVYIALYFNSVTLYYIILYFNGLTLYFISVGRRGGWVDWSLGIQCCSHGFESQWQCVRSAIITEAVFRSFLTMPWWFPRGTTISSINKKAAEVKFKIVKSCRGQLSAHLLSLHNRAGVASSRSALTSHRLKYKALVKIRHLFIYFIYLLLYYISIVWHYVIILYFNSVTLLLYYISIVWHYVITLYFNNLTLCYYIIFQ